jgi:glycosyltransferase involved in cell wall biosynthesis
MTTDQNNGVTIVIPAFREEDNIEAAIDNAVAAASSVTSDYEIIVVDDGSPDKTGEFARLKAEVNPNVRAVSNATNEGFGFSFARGVKMATKAYVTVFPGDNDMAAFSLKELISSRGGADLIITYMKKTDKRSLLRRGISMAFVIIMNTLFGMKLKYYNGAFICRRELLQSIPIKSTGLAALAECIVRLVKAGHEYKAIYFEHTGRKHEQSKALNFRSFKAVAATIWILFKDIYISPARRN